MVFSLDYGAKTKALKKSWEFCVGSCHATTALREDYRQQLLKCRRELGFRYIRFHGLFDDDMSVLKKAGGIFQSGREDREGLFLSFTNIDAIFDFFLSIGMKPFVELGFMPSAIKGGDTFVFHYRGLTSPPEDFEKWEWLVKCFTEHCVERYGLDEVRQWFFEVWNEPNLGGPGLESAFWGGTMEDYFALYAAAARGVKAVDSRLKVGGPATADNAWVPELIAYCREKGVPLDFVSTHHYPTDCVLGYKQTGRRLTGNTEDDEQEFAQMIEMSGEKWKYVPRGIMTEMVEDVVSEAEGLPLYYTEWNSASGEFSDSPFCASFIAKTVLDNRDLVEGYSFWTFSDIFEEGGMPRGTFHGGFGLLNLQGIPKASYRAFGLLNKLGDEIYEERGGEGTVDIYAVKKAACDAVQFMIVNHQSLLQDIREEEVKIALKGVPSFVKATVERVDEHHGNALRRWHELGAPDYPDERIIHELMAESCTEAVPLEASYRDGTASFGLKIPEQGIALVTLYL